MRNISLLILTLCTLQLFRCANGDDQNRATSVGQSSSNTKSDNQGEEGDLADEPVEVSGAYLTADYIPDIQGKSEDEVSIGVSIEKDGVIVDISQLEVTGQILNSVSGAVVKELSVEVAVTEYHFMFNIASSDAKNLKITVEAKDQAGRSKKIERKLDDMGGDGLGSFKSAMVFDFENLTPPISGLSAASFCDAKGPLDSVKNEVNGIKITVGSLKNVVDLPLSKSGTCFQKLNQYTGGGEHILLKPSEKLGTYIGSGLTSGATLNCFFAVVKVAENDSSSTKLYILDGSKTDLADLSRSASELKCP